MPTISFRCSERQKLELEERADGDVTAYIKARLFGADDSRDLLQHIADRLDRRDDRTAGSASASHPELGMLAEMLLLLRHTVKPDTLRQVQAEMERRDMEVWSSE